MKIEKKEYIKVCKLRLCIPKVKKKNLKFKVIKRRKSSRHRHLVTGLIKATNLNSKLLDVLVPCNDFNSINPDVFINYGSNTNYLSSKIRLDLVNSRNLWLNSRVLTAKFLGSNISASWRYPELQLAKSNARDVIYQQSYTYYPINIKSPFINLNELQLKHRYSHTATLTKTASLLNLI